MARNREERIRSAHPRTGGLILALSDEPQPTRAWAQGAEGERSVGAWLDSLTTEGCVVLHDRRLPGRRANVDHLVVAPAGVWIIYLKGWIKRATAGWVAALLEAAGVVEVDGGRPARIRLAKGETDRVR